MFLGIIAEFLAPAENDSTVQRSLGLCTLFLWLLTLVPFLMVALPARASNTEVATFDFSQHDFVQTGPVALNGRWLFAWDRLVPPNEVMPDKLRQLPDIWNIPGSGDEKLAPLGQATYRATVILPPSQEDWALLIPQTYSQVKVFVNGRESLGGTPIRETEQNYSRPHLLRSIVSIPAQADRVDITFQVQNNWNRRGGLDRPVYFGTESQIYGKVVSQYGLEWTIIGSLTLVGLYLFGLFFAGRFVFGLQDFPALLFGLACLSVAARQLVIGPMFTLSLDLAWASALKVNYIATIAMVPLIIGYLKSTYQKDVPRWAVGGNAAVFAVFAIVFTTMDLSLSVRLVFLFQLVIAFNILLMGFLLVRILVNQRPGAVVMSLSFMVLFGATINDMLFDQRLINSAELATYGFFVFVMIQSIIISTYTMRNLYRVKKLSQRLGNANDQLAKANVALERQIGEALQLKGYNESILASLKDGVITTDRKQKVVTANRAAREILEREDDEMIGRPALELFPEKFHWIIERLAECDATGATLQSRSVELELPHAKLVANLTFVPLRDTNYQPIGSILIIEDKTYGARLVNWLNEERERRLQAVKTAEEAEKRATTDALTGLGNRAAFDADVARMAHDYKIGRTPDVVVAMIDLDGLKQVNDTRGHEDGDLMLKLFADGLRFKFRDSDRAYRFGGDEYALLLPGVRGNHTRDFQSKLDQIVSDVRARGFPEFDASVGFSSLDDHQGNQAEALKMADERMYAMKRAHKAKLAELKAKSS